MSLAEFVAVQSVLASSRPLLEKYLADGSVEILAGEFDRQRKDATPVIMVYGIYNAGKSTLINALMGAELAAMGPVPKTDRIDAYPWAGFQLLDTPGLDAPIEHEDVTRDKLEQADVVIFAMASQGIMEQRKAYALILELVRRQRRVILVLNNKSGLEPGGEAFLEVVDKVRANLQSAATDLGMDDPLPNVPIEMVDAKSALRAKLEHKKALLEYSGMPRLEERLVRFLGATRPADVQRRLAADLAKLLERAYAVVRERAAELGGGEHEALRQFLRSERGILEAELEGRARQQAHARRGELTAIFEAGPKPQFEAQLDGVLEQFSDGMLEHLQARLQRLADDLGQMQESARIDAQAAASPTAAPQAGSFEGAPDDAPASTAKKVPRASLNAIWKSVDVQRLLDEVKAEHLVAAMQYGKKVFPALFKGIGKVTMGKWADNLIKLKGAAGRLPWLQAATETATAMWKFYEADRENQRQIDFERRRAQAVQDAVTRYTEGLVAYADALVRDTLDLAFSPANAQLKQMTEQYSAAAQAFTADLAQLDSSRLQLGAWTAAVRRGGGG